MYIVLSLLVCIIGLLMYLMAKTNNEVKTIGLHMFWVGLFVFLLGWPVAFAGLGVVHR